MYSSVEAGLMNIIYSEIEFGFLIHVEGHLGSVLGLVSSLEKMWKIKVVRWAALEPHTEALKAQNHHGLNTDYIHLLNHFPDGNLFTP